ncbi:MAG: toprim domain-containing protein [Hominenteromicrobium sp.]
MIHIQEAVIVEGRYDKIKLSALTDAFVVETNGFGIYKDAQKRAFIQKLAEERGIVILTDSDSAGRQIRGYLCSFIPKERIRHAYIPDMYGKEKRKASPSKEGKLGVEGVPAEVLLGALRDAGVIAEHSGERPRLTPADLMALGLTGCENSAALRRRLLKALALPENLSIKMLLRWLDTDEKLARMLAILENFETDA